ncbi:TonB family protein [Gloeobacter violaceus]|uniref:Gll3406 protein n=1 Tax=Gloeobacter violaceus (strain ATCC 29082 / PCC 7421) TaxID=251221 RepID=Q7NFW8_GLOVI|nr:TonB family protein [Gloeobacter violaceus]BAC91347.1 gll3406 [Gloeobacter violaceus PCC 7421]
MTANLLTRTRSTARLQVLKPLASLWYRFCALILDQALLLLVAFTLAQVFGALLSLFGAGPDGAALALGTLGLYAILALGNYLIWPLSHKGQTVGQRLVGIRMVSADDSDLNLGTLLKRHLISYLILGGALFVGYVFDSVLFGLLASGFLLVLAFIFASLDGEKQGLPDKFANTRMIADPRRTSANLYPAIVSSLFIHLLVAVAAAVLAIIIPLLFEALNIKFPELTPPEPPAPSMEFTLTDPTDKVKPPPNAPKSNANSVAKKRNRQLPTDAGVKGAPQARPTPQPRPRPTPPPPRAEQPTPRPEQPKPTPAPKPKAAPPPSPEAVLPKIEEPPKETSPELAPLPQETTPEPAPPAPAPKRRASRSSATSGSSLAPASALGGPLSASRGSGGNGGLGESGTLNPGRDGDGSGIDAAQDVDFGPYMAALQRKVKRNWIAPEAGNSRRTVLLFTISRNGQIMNLRVGRSSGSRSSDESAMEAVQRAAPFGPLPAAYKGDRIEIQFTFDINVFGGDIGGRGF